MRWSDADGVLADYNNIADKLEAAFGGKARTESYSGGVPGMSLRLPIQEYEQAKTWLTNEYGQPEVIDNWHPSQTKGIKPLRFVLGKDMSKATHINLICMMQQKGKRYVTLSWM